MHAARSRSGLPPAPPSTSGTSIRSTSPAPTRPLAKALSETIAGAVIPADVDDLAALPLGAYASVEGEGEVQLTGSVELASVVNPLATPGLPVIGSASISAGASVNVGAEFRASGGFEIRVTKIAGDRVRLSYYKRAGSEISIDATAAFGVSATIRDSDVLKRLIDALSGDPKANLEELVNAGLSDEQIEALQQAMAKSIDRTLRIAAELQFSSVRHGEALFAYDIDVAALTRRARRRRVGAGRAAHRHQRSGPRPSTDRSARSRPASSGAASAASPGASTCSASSTSRASRSCCGRGRSPTTSSLGR